MTRQFRVLLNKKTFFRGSSILAFTTVLSYGLGLLRDRSFAQIFGASRLLDAYNAAFILPDLILNIFVAGALSAAFVPIFSSLTAEDKKTESNLFVNSVLNGSVLMVIASGLLVLALAPQLSKYIVPGFDEATRQTFVNLTRLLLLSPIIFAVSNTFGNILLSREKFFWFGISAALYNLGIIGGVYFLSPFFGIYGVAIGTLTGSLFHLISRLISLAGIGFKYSLKISFTDYYKNFLKIMAPKMIGHPVEQLTFMGFTIIASGLGVGAIAILNFSRNFQSMPVNVIGVSFALAAFPLLSRLGSEISNGQTDKKEFLKEFHQTFSFVFIITALAAVLFYLFRNLLIQIFLAGGAFSSNAITLTAATLAAFSFSIPFESCSHLLARAFYSLKNSITPVIISLIGLGISIFAGYAFSRQLGLPGLALGFSTGSLIKTIILYVFLRFKLA